MQDLAKIILKASEIRENSWDSDTNYYHLPISDSVRKAMKHLSLDQKAHLSLAYLLLTYCWNDAIDWAKKYDE